MEKEKLFKKLEDKLGTHIKPCKSSNLVGYGYNRINRMLIIVFKANKVYIYDDVSEKDYLKLNSAESKGKWVHVNLVNHWGCLYNKSCTKYPV